ncbi:putative L-lysine-epsilon aminotransferase [compost metagenome]
MWAYQHYDVIPDVLAFGKKAQVCGILANKEKFDQVEHHVFKESSRINSTFGGDFIDMLRFKLILEVIEQENLLVNAAEKGTHLKSKLQEVMKDRPQLSNLRGEGLFVALDFDSADSRNEFIKRAYANKLIILGCGEKSIRFRPHLNISKEDIDKTIIIIEDSL